MSPRVVASSLALAAGASVAWLFLAGPALAQGVPTPSVPQAQADLDNCIADAREQGVPLGVATRGCVPDPEAFGDCMSDQSAADTPQLEALDLCRSEQESPSEPDTTYPDPGGSPPTVAPATTTAVTEPSVEPAPDSSPSASEPVAVKSGSDGLRAGPVALIALLAAGLGALVGALLFRRSGGTHGSGQSLPTSQPVTASGPLPMGTATQPPVAAPAMANTAADQERSTMIQAAIDAGDQVTSEAVRTMLTEQLRSVGVTPLFVPEGTAFDPTAHRGVQGEPAPSAEQDGTVARTDRPGWSDRGQVLRPPEVIVYRWEEQ